MLYALAGALGIDSKILLTPNCNYLNGAEDLKSFWLQSQDFFRKSSSDNWEEELSQIKKQITSHN